jgi:hypothetical protein
LGIDTATRIVGFFVSAIGVGLIFDGVISAENARPHVFALRPQDRTFYHN